MSSHHGLIEKSICEYSNLTKTCDLLNSCMWQLQLVQCTVKTTKPTSIWLQRNHIYLHAILSFLLTTGFLWQINQYTFNSHVNDTLSGLKIPLLLWSLTLTYSDLTHFWRAVKTPYTHFFSQTLPNVTRSIQKQIKCNYFLNVCAADTYFYVCKCTILNCVYFKDF